MHEGELHVHYSWQNPVLRESIYPFRKKKLLEFVLAFEEVEKLKEVRAKGADPATIKKMQEIQELLRDEHQRLSAELQRAIASRMERDKWLRMIKLTSDEKNLRYKRIFYFDRTIVDATNKLADRQGQKEYSLKRSAWYPETDARRQKWIDQAAALDPSIAEAEAELAELKKIRGLYDRQDRLPKISATGEMTPDMIARWEMLDRRNELDRLSHGDLIKMMQQRFEENPGRYPRWLQYMAFHFSGMRYKSSHGSWADPKSLLGMLEREFMEDEIRDTDCPTIDAECEAIALRLEAEKALTKDTRKIGELSRQIAQLRFFSRPKALLAYRTDQMLQKIENMKDPEVLARLEELRATHPELPPWFWKEVEKYTPLRLKTQDKDWEKDSRERWDFEYWRWTEILQIWETKDVTGWRAKHRNSLDLIVTRSVCNEIAEHIQHLRGVVPGAGLTAKPRFYMRNVKKTQNLPDGDPKKAFFKYPKKAEDFVSGASILWLGIVTTAPNPWQIVESLPGFEFSTDQGGGSFLRWTHEATVVGVEELLEGKYVLTFETGEIGLIRRPLSTLINNPNVLVGYVSEEPMPEEKVKQLDNMLKREKILQME